MTRTTRPTHAQPGVLLCCTTLEVPIISRYQFGYGNERVIGGSSASRRSYGSGGYPSLDGCS
jgi:hypothetical protein